MRRNVNETCIGSFHYLGFLNSVSKKTTLFYRLCQEGFKDKAFEVLKIREFTFVNDCFQNENNAVFGVFLQRLNIFRKWSYISTILLLFFLIGSNLKICAAPIKILDSLLERKEDLFGWMVMDMAENQNTNLIKEVINNPVVFYPNPVKDVIYFNFNQPTHIEIFDVIGHKHLKETTINTLNINSLPPGVYILRTLGRTLTKFIKANY